MMRWLTVLLSFLPIGCGAGAHSRGDGELVVGFVYIGPRDDFGYNQAHADGAAAVKRMPGVRVIEEERVPDTVDVQKTMKSMIDLDNARVIFPTSFNYFDPHTLKVAQEYPEVRLLHCGGLYEPGKHPANVGSFFGYIDECEYLSGIVAAHSTRSKVLGFVAGKPIPQVLRNINAFTLGARSIDPAITCKVVFTGDWNLPLKEAEAANSLIDSGADVLTCHVNSPKVVIETAEKRSIFTCGYHTSQAVLAPKGYLTGSEWCWEKVYMEYVRTIQAGKEVPHFVRGGLREGFVKPSPYGPAVGEAARQAADRTRARFLEGSFVIFQGPLKANSGKIVIADGKSYQQTAIELESMDYLVEGVIGQ
jgi:basic membrane protein A and related proteins